MSLETKLEKFLEIVNFVGREHGYHFTGEDFVDGLFDKDHLYPETVLEALASAHGIDVEELDQAAIRPGTGQSIRVMVYLSGT